MHVTCIEAKYNRINSLWVIQVQLDTYMPDPFGRERHLGKVIGSPGLVVKRGDS